eukprot:10041011-Ditylum_brightwellii.AAC.1
MVLGDRTMCRSYYLTDHPEYRGVYFRTMAIENLKALVWWACDKRAQGIIPHPMDFNAFTLLTACNQMNTKKSSWDALSDKVNPPKMLNPKYWMDKCLILESFPKTRPSASGKGSLFYVIFKAMSVGWTPISSEDRLPYATPHAGPFFMANNSLTYRIIKKWTICTKAFVYVYPFKDLQNRSGAMNSLQMHYNRLIMVAKRLAKAGSDLTNIQYKSKQHMSFKTFINKLNKVFFICSIKGVNFSTCAS